MQDLNRRSNVMLCAYVCVSIPASEYVMYVSRCMYVCGVMYYNVLV